MSHVGPLNGLPIACALTPDTGRAQVERWRAFDAEYARGIERSETELLIHYEKTDDSTRRLRELVATESECCSFVGWEIDDSHADLRLVVSGMPEQLAALNVG
ncbi:hypothetical protein PGC08_13190 [Brevibacterium sp. BDJS002]|uniref:hypothetical protein n=1 Tax=Brevibacterium sp. BDJS002 TaxID=3020906 RepID=UPI002307D81A|nr:hypothetical protein [Brevibacterium sp. BDJS002]WCE38957.1 hypothetical protein PGC08_13190 [Brevibacterium sp. BDJS002]